MPAPLPIRKDRDAAELRRLARRSRQRPPAGARRRTRRPPPRGGGPARRHDRPDARHWVHRYDVEDVEGPRDRPRPGRPCALDEGRQAAPEALVLGGPSLARDGRVAWRARDPCALVEDRFGVRHGEGGMLRLPKGLELSWQKIRPVHLEADSRARERFKKARPA